MSRPLPPSALHPRPLPPLRSLIFLAAVYSRLLADEIRIFPVHLHHSVVRDHVGRDF